MVRTEAMTLITEEIWRLQSLDVYCIQLPIIVCKASSGNGAS